MLNVEKYRALAYGSKEGLLLLDKVEENWLDWCSIVEKAPWLKNWRRSHLLEQQSCTPKGNKCAAPMAALALYIFSTTVWGIGIEDWLNKNEASTIMYQALIRQQNIKEPDLRRFYKWDNQMYDEFGKLVPIEIGELDRWLEHLY